ncbi:MAG: hypothetical protein EAZ08_00360 [Cytophagales bacterium]|nr:MAG: hypothetical protein EAZ08_00360 [Cytophagales bacterium]
MWAFSFTFAVLNRFDKTKIIVQLFKTLTKMKELSFEEMMDTVGGGLCLDMAMQIGRCAASGDWYCVGYLGAAYVAYCIPPKEA